MKGLTIIKRFILSLLLLGFIVNINQVTVAQEVYNREEIMDIFRYGMMNEYDRHEVEEFLEQVEAAYAAKGDAIFQEGRLKVEDDSMNHRMHRDYSHAQMRHLHDYLMYYCHPEAMMHYSREHRHHQRQAHPHMNHHRPHHRIYSNRP